MADDRVQRLLLTEKELTLEKAYQVCIAEETASKDTSVLKGEHVNKVSAQKKHYEEKRNHTKQQPESQDQKRVYFRCGDESHLANRCKHQNTPCNYCKKIVHLAKMCLKLKAKSEANAVLDTGNSDSNYDNEEIPVATITEEFCIYNTSNTVHPPITVPVMLEKNATAVDFQTDTGSGASIMNQRQFVQLLVVHHPS